MIMNHDQRGTMQLNEHECLPASVLRGQAAPACANGKCRAPPLKAHSPVPSLIGAEGLVLPASVLRGPVSVFTASGGACVRKVRSLEKERQEKQHQHSQEASIAKTREHQKNKQDAHESSGTDSIRTTGKRRSTTTGTMRSTMACKRSIITTAN